jgi:cytochrome c oxidase subunit 2
MLIPGYISLQKARFETPGEYLMPCQEFCSFGHEGMWGRVRVVSKEEFATGAKSARRLTCAE